MIELNALDKIDVFKRVDISGGHGIKDGKDGIYKFSSMLKLPYVLYT